MSAFGNSQVVGSCLSGACMALVTGNNGITFENCWFFSRHGIILQCKSQHCEYHQKSVRGGPGPLALTVNSPKGVRVLVPKCVLKLLDAIQQAGGKLIWKEIYAFELWSSFQLYLTLPIGPLLLLLKICRPSFSTHPWNHTSTLILSPLAKISAVIRDAILSSCCMFDSLPRLTTVLSYHAHEFYLVSWYSPKLIDEVSRTVKDHDNLFRKHTVNNSGGSWCYFIPCEPLSVASVSSSGKI